MLFPHERRHKQEFSSERDLVCYRWIMLRYLLSSATPKISPKFEWIFFGMKLNDINRGFRFRGKADHVLTLNSSIS